MINIDPQFGNKTIIITIGKRKENWLYFLCPTFSWIFLVKSGDYQNKSVCQNKSGDYQNKSVCQNKSNDYQYKSSVCQYKSSDYQNKRVFSKIREAFPEIRVAC